MNKEGGMMGAEPGQRGWKLKGGNQRKMKGEDMGTSWM